MKNLPKVHKKQSRLTGAVMVMVAQALVLLLGYVAHLWIGRVLGPGPYGTYGVVLSIQTIFGMILTLGVPVAISRFVAQDEKHAQSILWQGLKIQVIVSLITSVILLVFSSSIARILGDTSLTPLLQFVSIVIFAQAFYTVFQQYFSGSHHFKTQSLLTSLYAILKLVGAVSLIYYIGVYGAFAGFGIGGILAGFVGWWWAKSYGGKLEKKLPLKAFLSFAGINMLILVCLQLLISLDLFMVKRLLDSDVQAGYYNASVTLSRIPYTLLQSLMFILLPSVSALTKPGTSHDKAASFIKDALRYLIAVIVPGVVLAATTSESLIILFFSRDYIPAAGSLTILMIGLGALAFFQLLTSIVSGAGRARVGLIFTVVLIVLSSILGLILIPRYELLGAALQTTITGLIGLVLLSAYTFRSFRIPLPIRSTINILIASALVAALTYVWDATPLTLIPQYVIAGALYVAALFVLGEITHADRERIAHMHPRLRWIAPPSDV